MALHVSPVLDIQVEQHQGQQGDDEFSDSVPVVFHTTSYCTFYHQHPRPDPYLCGKTRLSMKKILKLYRNWHYRRLYCKLLFIYAKNKETCVYASDYADDMFHAITGLYYPAIRGE